MEIKCQVVLNMYDLLINNKKIYMNEIILKYNISKRTFYRYIAEINAFLYNNYTNQIIIYNRTDNSYKLESNIIQN